MGTYMIDNRNQLAKVGEVYLLSGMTLKVSRGGTPIEGPCEFVLDKLYIYPEEGDQAVLVNLGEEVEVLSEQRNMDELRRRQGALAYRQLSWREQMELHVTLAN